MKPPRDRTLTKPGDRNALDPQAVQLAHDEVVKLLTDGLGLGIFHNGVLVKVPGMITGTPRQVFHGLGRVPEISFPVKQTGNSGWFVAPGEDPRNSIILNTVAGVATDITWLIA